MLERTGKGASLWLGTGGSEKWGFMCEEEHNRKIATKQAQCGEARAWDHLNRKTTLGQGYFGSRQPPSMLNEHCWSVRQVTCSHQPPAALVGVK